MLIPITAKCEYTGKPEPLLVPEASIVGIHILLGKVAYMDGDKKRYADIDIGDVYRLKLERIPAPAGVTLRGRPVLYVELDHAHGNASVASMAEDGTVMLTDAIISREDPSDEDFTDRPEDLAVEKVLASKPAKKSRRKTASGGGSN